MQRQRSNQNCLKNCSKLGITTTTTTKMDDFQCCLLHDGTLKGCPVRFTWLWQTGHSSSNMQLSPKTILKGIKSFGETIADRIQWFFGFKAHFPGT